MKKVLLGLVIALMMTGSGYSQYKSSLTEQTFGYTDEVEDVNIDLPNYLEPPKKNKPKPISNRSEYKPTKISSSGYGSASQCNLLERLMSLHYENMNFYSYKFLKHSGNDSEFRTKYIQYAEQYIQHLNLLKDTSDIYNNICN